MPQWKDDPMLTVRGPVYTEATRCQDCYKCVRECSVKAVRVQGGCAQVTTEECVACGHCVEVCPSQAKRIRDDLPVVKDLLASGRRVVVSLAPSFPAAFPDLPPDHLVAGLKRLGFHSVSETARGAQEVSATVARLLADSEPRLWLSSACPAAVDYLKKFHPHLGDRVTDLLSPMLAHGRMLKAYHGPDTVVVFIGPCIAKKREAEAFPDLVAACLTFTDLERAWAEAGIVPTEMIPGPDDRFGPFLAREGTLYPIEGGMIAGITAGCTPCDAGLMSLAGLDDIAAALHDLDGKILDQPLFVELLACRGGCIAGPGLKTRAGTLARRLTILKHAREDILGGPRKPTLDIATTWATEPVAIPEVSTSALTAALALIGKTRTEDEFNCGGCGYDRCRDFAHALALGRAEVDMCVSHTRRQAQGKAEALLAAMPAAAVLVDQALTVVDCNKAFARILGLSAPAAAIGRKLEDLPPLARRLDQILAGQVATGGELRLGDATYTGTFFAVDAGRLVGAVLSDITVPAEQRAEVARKAHEVITKNLETVQRIAFLLGENAAETEAMLSALAGSLDTQDA